MFLKVMFKYIRLGTGRTFIDRTGPAGNRPVEILDLTGKKPVKTGKNR
jgi:hypothetical protein